MKPLVNHFRYLGTVKMETNRMSGFEISLCELIFNEAPGPGKAFITTKNIGLSSRGRVAVRPIVEKDLVHQGSTIIHVQS